MKRTSSERVCAPSMLSVAWVDVPKGATKKRPAADQAFFPELGKFVGIDFSVRAVCTASCSAGTPLAQPAQGRGDRHGRPAQDAETSPAQSALAAGIIAAMDDSARMCKIIYRSIALIGIILMIRVSLNLSFWIERAALRYQLHLYKSSNYV